MANQDQEFQLLSVSKMHGLEFLLVPSETSRQDSLLVSYNGMPEKLLKNKRGFQLTLVWLDIRNTKNTHILIPFIYTLFLFYV